jgi:hypothetical protein
MFDKKLPRREFLRMGSVIVAGTAAAGLIPGRSLFAGATDGVAPVSSVGFAPSAPEDGAHVGLQYASAIGFGDPGFLSHRAAITVTDFTRGAKFRTTGNSFEVDAIFPANSYSPDKYPRFRAWLTPGRDDGENAAAGARFTMPVTSTEGARLVVRKLAIDGSTDPGSESLLTFSTGVESGTLKLQRGIYVVALREPGRDAAPTWGSFTLARDRQGALTIPNANFSYLLLTIDYDK